MRVQLCICANNLPKLHDSFASVRLTGREIGRTEVVKISANPHWEKIFIFDFSDVQATIITVCVLSEDEGECVGSAEFNIGKILAKRSKVIAKAIEGGGTIFAHAAEPGLGGSLKFQICGKGLKNFERFCCISSAKSDPFFELQRAPDGNYRDAIVYTSEVQEETLNPLWSEAKVDLKSLCDGDLASSIKFIVYDKDPGEKRKLMGTLETTVNGLMAAYASGEDMALTLKGKKTGYIVVLQAKLIGYISALNILRRAASAKEAAVASKVVADAKAKEAAIALEEAEKARVAAEKEVESELAALLELEEAQAAAAKAKAAAEIAAHEFASLQMAGIVGTLEFQFRGKDLKNMESFGFLRKSDPFFVLQTASTTDGEISWSHVYISNVVKNNLNPKWSKAEVEVSKLCSDDLDEPIRVIVSDHERDKKHDLIGSVETSINGILSAQKSGEALILMKAGKETGRIFVPSAKLSGLVDPKKAAERAEKLAKEAENALFFAIGREHKASHATKKAKAANDVAKKKEQFARSVTEEAEATRRAAPLEKSVSAQLSELGLGS